MAKPSHILFFFFAKSPKNKHAKGCAILSHEKIIVALTRFGLSRTDAEIYLFLSNRGRQSAKDITEGLNLPKPTVYTSLKRLKKEGTIVITHERVKRFSARSFEEITNSQVETKLNEAESLRKCSKQILSIWYRIIEENSGY